MACVSASRLTSKWEFVPPVCAQILGVHDTVLGTTTAEAVGDHGCLDSILASEMCKLEGVVDEIGRLGSWKFPQLEFVYFRMRLGVDSRSSDDGGGDGELDELGEHGS